MGLERFHEAQRHDYDRALREIENGRKTSHWMWYIFPQLKGMGRSYISQYYAIDSFAEAKEYLNDPILSMRLVHISEALLKLGGRDPVRIFGETDAQKLRSCMTLFSLVTDHILVFDKVLDQYFHGSRCQFTVQAFQKELHFQPKKPEETV